MKSHIWTRTALAIAASSAVTALPAQELSLNTAALTPVTIGFSLNQETPTQTVTSTDVDGDGLKDQLSIGERIEITYGGDGAVNTVYDDQLGTSLNFDGAEQRVQDLLLAKSIASKVEIVQGESLFPGLGGLEDSEGVLPSLPKRLTIVAVESRVLPSGTLTFVDPEGNFYILEFGVLFRFTNGSDINNPDIIDNVRAVNLLSTDGSPIDPYSADQKDIVFGDSDDSTASKNPAPAKSNWFWEWLFGNDADTDAAIDAATDAADVAGQGISGGLSLKTIKQAADIAAENAAGAKANEANAEEAAKSMDEIFPGRSLGWKEDDSSSGRFLRWLKGLFKSKK